jgi:(p)ppGpp synthase/HD superfamily hydrolase
MTNIVERAAAFARAAHAGQLRKWSGEPYFVHVEAVAKAIAAEGADEATIAAAYLHDTLEDTETTYPELIAEFGSEVAMLVLQLTNVYTSEAYPKLNRRARKALETARLAKAHPKAKAIKRADIADNTSTIVGRGGDFAKVYLAEKADMMKVL